MRDHSPVIHSETFSTSNDTPHQLQSIPQELLLTFTIEESNRSKYIDTVFQDTSSKIYYSVFQQHPGAPSIKKNLKNFTFAKPLYILFIDLRSFHPSH